MATSNPLKRIAVVNGANKPLVETPPALPKKPYYICPRCGNITYNLLKEHVTTISPLYKTIEVLPLCNNCLGELFNQYCELLNDEKAALKLMCMHFDIYYAPSTYAKIKIQSKQSKLIEYIRRCNVLYPNLTFDNNYIRELADDNTVEESDSDGVSKRAINLFGYGFEEDEYKFLLTQYNDWTRRYECNTKALEELIKMLCLVQLDIHRASQNGEDTAKLLKTFQELLSSANLKPSQTGDDSVTGEYSLGQMIDVWEETKPIPQSDDPQFNDRDGIITYITTWFLGHLARIFGKKNKYTTVYDNEISKYTVDKPHYNGEDDESLNALFDNNRMVEDGDS